MTEDLINRIRLVRSPGIGPITYRQLTARFGSASAALAAVPDLARRGGGAPPRLAGRDQAEREIARVEKLAPAIWCWVWVFTRGCSPSSTTLPRC